MKWEEAELHLMYFATCEVAFLGGKGLSGASVDHMMIAYCTPFLC